MDNTTRFNQYIKSLEQFVTREGHCRVPAVHVENYENKSIALGAWVGYMRQRKRKNQLSPDRAARIEAVSGWTWGPLKPGPATDAQRNEEIHQLRAEGKSLRQIADRFALSRQRVHQIVKRQEV